MKCGWCWITSNGLVMAEVRIILQARLDSRRLPGKALLPLAGYPMLALAGLRAANTGLRVIVATSYAACDDAVAATAKLHGLEVFRGSRDNVYSRFVDASADMCGDDWLVRLTADNVFPDGAFIELLLAAAAASERPYLGTASPDDGLPYGLSGEVFKVAALREVGHRLSKLDLEHVTTGLRRECGPAGFDGLAANKLGHLRCTVDCFADYARLLQVFANVHQPLLIPWQALCTRLSELPDAPQFRIPSLDMDNKRVGRMVLGTAQLGLPCYGRTNQTGQPAYPHAEQLVKTALRHGVTHIDCARAYGEAEDRIGNMLQSTAGEAVVITKLSPLVDLPTDASAASIRSAVEASLFRSLHALRQHQLDVVMMHRWDHYSLHRGQIWKLLLEFQQSGWIGELGASVYDPADALEALQVPEIKHLQIPFHLLDHRWHSLGFEGERLQRPDVLVHGRSSFLQGVLLAQPLQWPPVGCFDSGSCCRAMDRLVGELGRESRADLCVAYARGSGMVDTLVIGVENCDQLEQNLRLMTLSPLTAEASDHVRQSLPQAPVGLLNPNLWTSFSND